MIDGDGDRCDEILGMAEYLLRLFLRIKLIIARSALV